MSNDVPVQLIVAAFQDEQGAKMALKELKAVKREGLIKIDNAAILRMDEKGKLHIKETHDMGGGKGAALGGVAGAAVGLIAGPALLVPAAVGALIGGLAAKFRDSGFSDERLKMVGQNLTPGSSAIIAVVEHKWVKMVMDELEEAGADAFAQEIGADIASQLQQGHEVAYSALASDAGLEMSRVAGGEDEIEASTLVIDDSGAYGARFIATPEGFAAEEIAMIEDGIAYVAIEGEFEEEVEETEAAEAPAEDAAAEDDTAAA